MHRRVGGICEIMKYDPGRPVSVMMLEFKGSSDVKKLHSGFYCKTLENNHSDVCFPQQNSRRTTLLFK